MKVFRICRFPTTREGTFGVMFEQSKEGDWIPFVISLERQWLNNEKGKSCIPKGEYLCKRVNSPKFSDTWEVTGVPGRSEILFHKGNLDDDSHGCILIAEMFDMVYDKIWNGWSPGVSASGKGFDEFLKKLEKEQEFKVVIEEI